MTEIITNITIPRRVITAVVNQRIISVTVSAGAAILQAGIATAQAGIATAQAEISMEKAIQTAADRVQTGKDATQTGLDRAQTGMDLTAAEAAVQQTALDRQATAGDAAQTGLDRAAVAAATSLTPGPGKIPLSGPDGRFSADWIRLATNDIGIPGWQGFGVGICPSDLPAGMAALDGTTDIASDNYGNYQFSDGSIMCWIPAFFYKYGTGSNGLQVNAVSIKPLAYFADVAAANAAGYALHRAFYDGGVEKSGFFVDKYQASNNSGIASSLKNGAPLSSSSAHNPFSGLTGTPPNAYYGAFAAAKTRGVGFFCSSSFIFSALALLSLAHGQKALSSAWCTWFDAAGVTNFPKGNNNNALKDSNDGTVIYTTDGYPNCGKTGSGLPFAKTTHNGQNSGVADLNGNVYEISPGLTCTAIAKAITGVTLASPCVLTVVGHVATTGALLQVSGIVGTTQLNDKIFTLTVVDADHVSLDGVDATAFTAWASGGTATYGTFSLLKTTAAMKNITGGNTMATDHWGAAGIAANFDTVIPNFNTVYPNNGFVQKYGSGANQVLSEGVSGSDWARTGAGLPMATGMSTDGTNGFGLDYYYQKIVNELCPIAGGYWFSGSYAGVWNLPLNGVRGNSYNSVGFRAALYL